MSTLHETTHSMGAHDRIHIDGDFVDFAEGDAAPIVNVMLDVGSEALTVTLDEYHLREFRLAIQRAEKWLKSEKVTP